MSRRPAALSRTRLARRQLRTDPATVLLVVLATFVTACVLAAWPRTVDRVVGADQADVVARLTASQIDPTRSGSWLADTGSGSPQAREELAGLDADLRGTAAAAGPALWPLLGDPRAVLSTGPWPADRGPRPVGIAELSARIRVDPLLPDLVTVVEGRLPAAADVPPVPADAAPRTGTGPDAPLELALSATSAERIDWRVGESRRLGGGTGVTAVLVGTFDARDPDDPTWRHVDSTFVPQVVENPDRGTLVDVFPYADAGALPLLAVSGPLDLTMWFTIDTGPTATADRGELLRDLRAFRTATATDTELDAALADLGPRQGLVVTVLGVLAAGPAAVALGVLWLAVTLAVDRRRAALVLLRARGASAWLTGGLCAAQGLVLGLPAAAVGALAAVAAVPGPVRAADLVLPLVTGLVPAVLLGVAGGRVRATRAALAGAVRPAVGATARTARWVVEVGLVALAAVAVLAVRRRGLQGDAAGVDPVLLALPLLLSLAICVVVLRLLPAALGALGRALGRRAGLAGFVGAAGAARAPAAGFAPVAAVALGVAVTTASLVVLTTMDGGARRAGVAAVGADVAVTSPLPLSAQTVDAVRRLPGVAAVAPVGEGGEVALRSGRTSDAVDVHVLDLEALMAVQRDLPGVTPFDTGPAGSSDEVRAVVVGEVDVDLDDELVVVRGTPAQEHPLTVAAVADRVPGVGGGAASVLVDEDTARRLGIVVQVDHVLVRVTADADPTRVADAVRAVVEDATGAGAATATRADVTGRVTDGALVGGVRQATGLATLTSLALSALALTLGVTLGGRSRGRQLALLTTLGVPSRDTRALVRWEVLPWSLVAVAAGLAAGALLAPVVLGTTDVSVLTGGAQPPDPTLGLPGLGVLTVTYALLVAGAVRVAGAGARRTSAVAVLREGEA